MRTLTILASLVVTLGTTVAAAEPTRCTLVKIKDKDVTIDVPVTAKIGPDIQCKTAAQRIAKQYAVDNRVCDPKNAREGTFPLKVTWGSDGKVQTFALQTYCPTLAKRK